MSQKVLTYFVFFYVLMISVPAGLWAKTDSRPYEHGKYYSSKKEILEDAKTRALIRYSNFQKGDIIGDIGTENGYIPAILSMFYDEVDFYLQDINPASLNEIEFSRVKAYYEELNGKKFSTSFHFQIGEQSKTMLPAHKFDYIMMNDVIHQVYYPDSLLKDVYQKLKKKGILMIGQYIHNGILESTIMFFASKNGFQLKNKYVDENFQLFFFEKSGNEDYPLETIHEFSISGDLNKIKELISREPELVNSADELGFSPLMYASKYGQLNTAKLLIGQNADVNHSSTIYPVSALLLAVRNNHIDIVKLLLENQAEPNFSFQGVSALMIAAENGNMEMANLLINYNANIYLKFEGKNACFFAVASGNLELVKYFFKISKIKINASDQEGRTLLSYAATTNNPEVITYLIERKKAKTNKKDKWGKKPVDYAWNNSVIEYLTLKEAN